MAKGNSNRGSANGTPSSLTTLLSPSKITRPIVLSSSYYIPTNGVTPNGPTVQFDRRRFRPDASTAPPGAVNRASTRLNIDTLGKRARNSKQGFYSVGETLAYAIPSQVAICVRRKVRREVLHALHPFRKSGKGSGQPRKRNFWSRIHC